MIRFLGGVGLIAAFTFVKTALLPFLIFAALCGMVVGRTAPAGFRPSR